MPIPTITPVILSGGQGKRLWPLSREDQPKQFIPLFEDRSLFEDTVFRCRNDSLFSPPLVLCAQQHRFLARKLLAKSGQADARIIMEPSGRNTAAAVSVAALAAARPEDVLLILPSDHYIPNREEFWRTVEKAAPLVAKGRIVTFGITPSSPYTGFGYIERGAEIEAGYEIKKFHEKPDQQTAESYLESGMFYWNAGILMTRSDSLLAEMEKHAPDILDSVKAAWNKRQVDLGDDLLYPPAFAVVRSQSIDYAVLEKTARAAVVPAAFEWDDLGSWEALWRVSVNDKAQNFVKGHVYSSDVSRSYLRTEGPVLAVLGMDDVVAVATPEAVLIAPRHRSEEVRGMVEQMGQQEPLHVTRARRTLRPWGYYEVIEEKENYRVRKLMIEPGKSLSAQKHSHRSEHWAILAGRAKITRENEVFHLSAHESMYISGNTLHRLENVQDEDLEIIEVQIGSYLGEDDIVRADDAQTNEVLKA